MTKKDLISSISNNHPDISRELIEQSVQLFFEIVSFYLIHHQRIELRGFGVFSVRERKEHIAHNPQTGESLMVPVKMVPFFKPSQNLKEELKKALQSASLAEENKRQGFFSFLHRFTSF